MLNTRIIPCLLLMGERLVKTVAYRRPAYLGEPRNAVRILNTKEVDELIILDITASVEKRPPDFTLIEEIVSECFMPVAYGGGITSLEQLKKLFYLGVEKAVLNAEAIRRPDFVAEAAGYFGSQSIVVAMDVKKRTTGGYRVWSRRGRVKTSHEACAYARDMEKLGAGELFLTSIQAEGSMRGYDCSMIRAVSSAVTIPVIAHGGAGSLDHLAEAVKCCGASAAAAGSLFVYQGIHRAVLINYPERRDLDRLFSSQSDPEHV